MAKSSSSAAQAFVAGMVRRGWTPAEAAATAGNVAIESGFDTSVKSKAPGENSYGLMQWNGARLRGLKAMAEKTGRSWTDPEVQMDWIDMERSGDSTKFGGGSEKAAYQKAFAGGGSPGEMAIRFGRFVERPADIGASAAQRRAAAEQAAGGTYTGAVDWGRGSTRTARAGGETRAPAGKAGAAPRGAPQAEATGEREPPQSEVGRLMAMRAILDDLAQAGSEGSPNFPSQPRGPGVDQLALNPSGMPPAGPPGGPPAGGVMAGAQEALQGLPPEEQGDQLAKFGKVLKSFGQMQNAARESPLAQRMFQEQQQSQVIQADQNQQAMMALRRQDLSSRLLEQQGLL